MGLIDESAAAAPPERRAVDDDTADVGVAVGGGVADAAAQAHATAERRAVAPEPERTGERPGHPVRDAVLITLAAVGLLALLVFAVFKLTIRPRTERRPAALQSIQVTRPPV